MRFAGRLVRIAGALMLLGTASFAQPHPALAARAASSKTSTAKQLEQLSRELKDKNFASAYTKLSAIAAQKNAGVLGSRAALALGYFDFGRGHFPEAAKWLDLAKADPLLRSYSLFWLAQTHLALGRSADALAELKRFREQFPDSVMTEDALQSLGNAAFASNQPADAVSALDAYPATGDKPALLFLRAQAREKTNQPLAAVSDYMQIYRRFPLTEQGRQAVVQLNFLASTLGDKMPQIPLDQRIAHADAQFAAKNWGAARDEYAQLLPQLSAADNERAGMRILSCGLSLGAPPAELAALKIDDPDVDAERYLLLAQFYRSSQQETQMAAAIESSASRAPASKWAEQALFLGGNYYWTQLNRDTAAAYYKRVEENFPMSSDATSAHWRVAWVAVLKRQDGAAGLLSEHLRRFPGSQYMPDAIYWLGRLAEEAKDPVLARSYYDKLTERYPQNYFAIVAATRLRSLGSGAVEDPEELNNIPPVPAAPKLSDRIPAPAADRHARADALRSIGFDASAELELRAAYASTREPRLLIEAAQAAVAAGHYGAAIVAVRQVYPQLDTHPIGEIPREAWLAAYALPFDSSIRQWSSKSKLDPMLVAGLIHQESAFSTNARSVANALGLMQLIPETAHKIAKQAKVRYSQARLFDADYNIHLGTIYLANLRQQFDGVEYAVAAYNAGEDRVAAWTAGQNYREPAEFVDSIPFTETRDYVEIVTRNADIYRKLYGETNESRKPATRRSR